MKCRHLAAPGDDDEPGVARIENNRLREIVVAASDDSPARDAYGESPITCGLNARKGTILTRRICHADFAAAGIAALRENTEAYLISDVSGAPAENGFAPRCVGNRWIGGGAIGDIALLRP